VARLAQLHLQPGGHQGVLTSLDRLGHQPHVLAAHSSGSLGHRHVLYRHVPHNRTGAVESVISMQRL
jgi:hypothetical protein